MKPLRLTLKAVGPYAGCQVIDFRTALESRLFGIYGPTGAGKSTIFSAMMFALFGEASREDQLAKTLRSDHADPALMTEVELVFETHGRVYRIVRRPEQMRPARRGGGETREGHKAWLFDATGLDLAAIGNDVPGKVIAEGKVEAVTTQIERLLGYGPDQFRQIVLLPQGRFETFLAASTPDRLKILRELFDVSLYRRLAERMKEEADDTETAVRTARDVCAGRLSAEGFATSDALRAGIEVAAADLAIRRDEAVAAKTAAESAGHDFQAAALKDKAFTEHGVAERGLKALREQGEEFRVLEKRLEQAHAAERIIDTERGLAQARGHAQDQARLAAEAEQSKGAAEFEETTALEALKALTARSDDHERDEVMLKELEAHAVQLRASAGLQEGVTKADGKAQRDRTRAEQSKAHHGEQTRLAAEAGRQHDAARKAAMDRAELRTKEIAIRQALHTAQTYERARRELSAATKSLALLEAGATAAVEQFAGCQKAFDEAEGALMADHAVHIAAHLMDGEPCPACGAREHPAPARGTAQGASLSEIYQRQKSMVEDARTLAEEARMMAASARDGHGQRQAGYHHLPVPARPTMEIEAELGSIRDALAALGPDVDFEALDARRSELAISIAAAFDACAADEVAARSSETTAALAAQSLGEALKTIPSEFRDASLLMRERDDLARCIAQFATALATARGAERSTNDALIAARTAAAKAADAGALAKSQLDCIEAGFLERLTQVGLRRDSFDAGKADITRAAELATGIAQYKEQVIRADERFKKAALAVAKGDRPDISALEGVKVAADAAQTAANDASAAAKAHLDHLHRLATALSAEHDRLDRLETETGPLRELAIAFTGHNESKIDLETFAIGAMFDEVLEAANQRLVPMSRGRYRLVRETEVRGNARRGLGLAVEDAFTGRQRPTATLSGGETFIAALALALGLSDVVESTRGGVRLDAIFIDEGFGSLDAEGDSGTLEQVLESLQDLVGRNRAVGLISHVPLVQQRIPNGFWITKTASGSFIEVRS